MRIFGASFDPTPFGINLGVTEGWRNTSKGLNSVGSQAPTPSNKLGAVNPGTTRNAPAPSVTSGGGGGSSLDHPVLGDTAPDPYAKYGGEANYNRLVDNFTQTLGNIRSSANSAGTQKAKEYNASILDFLDSLRMGQSNIDNQFIQNELAKQQGTADVNASVGRGIRSGGVMLANRNAGDSSGAEGLARAYGELGRQQLTGVGNQYAQGQNAIQQAQENFDLQRASGQRQLGVSRDGVVNGILDSAQQALAQLDANAINASIPQRVDIEREKANIKAAVLEQLSQYDEALNSGLGKINPLGADTARIRAAELARAGQAPASAFDYTAEVPMQFQNTGPFASELPIFTFPQGRREQVA